MESLSLVLKTLWDIMSEQVLDIFPVKDVKKCKSTIVIYCYTFRNIS